MESDVTFRAPSSIQQNAAADQPSTQLLSFILLFDLSLQTRVYMFFSKHFQAVRMVWGWLDVQLYMPIMHAYQAWNFKFILPVKCKFDDRCSFFIPVILRFMQIYKCQFFLCYMLIFMLNIQFSIIKNNPKHTQQKH